MFEIYVNELFYKAYDRSVVLSSPALTNEKTIAAEEKFTHARDRASRWKFMIGDLILGTVRPELGRQLYWIPLRVQLQQHHVRAG